DQNRARGIAGAGREDVLPTPRFAPPDCAPWNRLRNRLIARKKLNRPGTSRVVGDGRSQWDGITRSELLALLRLVQGKHWRRRPADNRENTAIGSGAPVDLVSGMKHNLIAIRTNRKGA